MDLPANKFHNTTKLHRERAEDGPHPGVRYPWHVAGGRHRHILHESEEVSIYHGYISFHPAVQYASRTLGSNRNLRLIMLPANFVSIIIVDFVNENQENK